MLEQSLRRGYCLRLLESASCVFVSIAASVSPVLRCRSRRERKQRLGEGVGEKKGSSVVLNRRVIVREGAGFDLVFEQIPEISP